MGKAHISVAHQLIDQLEQCVKEFRETQRDKRKRVSLTFAINFSWFNLVILKHL